MCGEALPRTAHGFPTKKPQVSLPEAFFLHQFPFPYRLKLCICPAVAEAMAGTAITLRTRTTPAPAMPSGAPTTARGWWAPMAVLTGAVRMCLLAELVGQGLNFFSNQAVDGAAIGAIMGVGHRG